mgnify:CR=1 FL=1
MKFLLFKSARLHELVDTVNRSRRDNLRHLTNTKNKERISCFVRKINGSNYVQYVHDFALQQLGSQGLQFDGRGGRHLRRPGVGKLHLQYQPPEAPANRAQP